MSSAVHQHTGNCPRCGAPVFAVVAQPAMVVAKPSADAPDGHGLLSLHVFAPEDEGAKIVPVEYVRPVTSKDPPAVHYTCTCRDFMPGGFLDGDDDSGDETLETADRKALARRRQKPPESDSVERVD